MGMTTPNTPGTGGPRAPQYTPALNHQSNCVIEMYLDFERLLLSFAVDGTYYPNGQRIDKTTVDGRMIRYRAAVTMYKECASIDLLMYDNIKSAQILAADAENESAPKFGNAGQRVA